jgi:hypothetical protein
MKTEDEHIDGPLDMLLAGFMPCQRCGNTPASQWSLAGGYTATLCDSCMNDLTEAENAQGFMLRIERIYSERVHLLAQTHQDGKDRLDRLLALADEEARLLIEIFVFDKQFESEAGRNEERSR